MTTWEANVELGSSALADPRSDGLRPIGEGATEHPGPEPFTAPGNWFAEEQLAAVDSIVAGLIARIEGLIPELTELPLALHSDMAAWLKEICTAAFAAIARGDALDTLGPMIERTARRRKSQGISQVQTMRASEIAQRALLDHFTEQIRGREREAELLRNITRHLLDFQRVITLHVTLGYTLAPSSGSPSDRVAGVQRLLGLLTGRSPSNVQPGAAELATQLGMSEPIRLVTVSVPLGAAAGDRARSIGRLNHWSVVGVLDQRMVALTARPPNSFSGPRGVAQVPEDAATDQIAAAVARAGTAADVAQRLGVTEMSAVESAPFAAMLTLPEAERDAFVASCFGDLHRSARGLSLLRAVAAVLNTSRLGDAAQSLHVHRHTLDYRLRRFTETTGVDLNDPVARMRCILALFLIGELPGSGQVAGAS